MGLLNKVGAKELLKLKDFVHVCSLCGATDHKQVKLANGWTFIGCPKVPEGAVIPDYTEDFMRRTADSKMNAVFPIDRCKNCDGTGEHIRDSGTPYSMQETCPVCDSSGKEKGPTSSEAEPKVCALCSKPYNKCFCIPL